MKIYLKITISYRAKKINFENKKKLEEKKENFL